MKIVVTKAVAGPDGAFDVGKVYDLPLELAQVLIASFAAEPLADAQREAKALRSPRVETRG